MSLLFLASLMTGLAAGVIAGLLGVGGGILIVPALLFLFFIDGMNSVISMQLAVGTSLATIVVTNLSATWNHHLRNSVDWEMVPQYAPGILMGAWFGAQTASGMNGETLRLAFGVFEIVVGLAMILQSAPGKTDAQNEIHPFLHPFLGFGIGFLSSLFGIGGGTLSVPTLNLLTGLTIHRAVGTSSALGIILALAGATGYIHAGWNHSALPPHAVGFVVPAAFLGIVVGTLLTTPLGVRLAHTFSPGQLKKGFGYFLLVVGLKLVWV
ncbi:MAG: sulfite exporter TauE/SafE family protein [Magnetococcales bacterium]|nr:sulfite exporter TauE/SafE family protein [Magnetococcales bacterium]